MTTPGLALYDNALYDEVLYDEDIPFVPPGVPPDAAMFRISLGDVPQTFDHIFAQRVAAANQKRVE